ncbi:MULTISPECIES: YbdD/YjiX family protein [Streptomyces]|uniref:YbdD/YjiX family protein n=1 Tax=Streptomyces TaxID=1883 RepID=UPI002694702A|nr:MULTISPECIES: YbdD/YjiX family protein [Streptomyces]
MNALTAPRRALAWLRWYVTELTGENAYQRYRERAEAADPGAPLLSRREFERMRTDRRYADPTSHHGCC